jgi:hypothetical protein
VSRASGGRPALALAGWLLRLYPSGFRARHGDELLAWVAERGLGPLVALDLARGALDAHLHPDLAGERRIRMCQPQRLRGLVLGVLCGYAAFVLAGVGYQKLTEYDDFVAAARHHAAVGAAFDTVVGASLVALAAMLAAGLPIGLTALRQALAGRRELLRPLGVVAAAVVWFAGTLVLAWRARGLPAGQTDSVVGVGGMIASFVLATAAGVAGAVAAVRRTQLPTRLLRFAAGAAVVATVAMVAMLAATLTWGLALRTTDPALFHSAQGIRASSTAGSWATIVVLMTAATAVAGVACARGLRAARRGPDPTVATQP